MAKKVGGKIQIDRESPEFKDRLERFREQKKETNRKTGNTAMGRAKKAFGEQLLGSYGFGQQDFSPDGYVRSKLGLFAEAINRDKQDQPIPKMEQAKTEPTRDNPNISTLINQLESLIKVANRVGVVTTEQQRSYQQQMTSNTRRSREQSMEGGMASMLSGAAGVGTSLTPLTTEIGTLIEKIKPLQDSIEEQNKKAQEEYNNRSFGQRLADSYGLGEEYADFDKKRKIKQSRIKTKPGFTVTRDAVTGQTRFRGPSGGYASRAAAIADAAPSRLQTVSGAARSGGAGILNLVKRSVSKGAMATRVAGAKVAAGVGSLSKGVASIVGKGVRGAGAAANATKSVSASVIKRIAGPIIGKAIGTTALKSIPILGTVVGGIMAAKKLVKGDVVGAGLEAASGLAGPLTAIPALIASVGRDTYSAVFRVQPERDPNFVKRMALITGVITTLVTSMLASKVEAKEPPTQAEINKSTVPVKRTDAAATTKETPSGTPKPVPTPTTPKSNPSPETSKAPPTSTPKTSATSGASAYSAKKTSDTSSSNLKGVETYMASSEYKSAAASETPSPSPTKMDSAPDTSQALAKISAEVEAGANGLNVINLGGNKSRPLPSVFPPTKSGVSGAGDVPDPHYYNMGSIAFDLYFNANPSTTS